MIDELMANHDVSGLVATVKERNFRSLTLLKSLGFERSGQGDEDEIVMTKKVHGVPDA
jgi:RimJ/RimL family protein N-acetyltransferase